MRLSIIWKIIDIEEGVAALTVSQSETKKYLQLQYLFILILKQKKW